MRVTDTLRDGKKSSDNLVAQDQQDISNPGLHFDKDFQNKSG